MRRFFVICIFDIFAEEKHWAPGRTYYNNNVRWNH